MKIKESEMEILERYFNNIYEDENSYEMETWTNKGVNMIIDLEKDGNELLEQLKDYVDNFDIDSEIDLYRENKEYRNNFTLEESLEDFKDYINYVKNLINELEHRGHTVIGEKYKKTLEYRYLEGIIEDMQDGETVKYNIDKSIENILNDDYLWDNFFNSIRNDLIKERIS